MTKNSDYGNSNKAIEPVNLSEVIAKIDVEMYRLGWKTDQGREYLKKNYRKRSRFLLT